MVSRPTRAVEAVLTRDESGRRVKSLYVTIGLDADGAERLAADLDSCARSARQLDDPPNATR